MIQAKKRKNKNIQRSQNINEIGEVQHNVIWTNIKLQRRYLKDILMFANKRNASMVIAVYQS